MDRLHVAISGIPRQPVVTELIYYQESKEKITRQKCYWKSEAVTE